MTVSTTIIDEAIAYVAAGWFVFPTIAKKPATRHGFLDAVSTEDEARALFQRHPEATGIGVACGGSKLLVVDLDGEGGLLAWTRIAARQGDTMPTRIAVTPRGWHLFFRTTDPRARSSAGRLATYVDTRGPGGYVVVPPSLHPSGQSYRWRDRSMPVADAPEWLLAALEPPPPPQVGSFRELAADALVTAYGRVALAGLVDDLLSAAEGTRNATLVATAYRAGRLTAGGEIAAEVAHDVLVDAARQVGLPELESERTFHSGFSAGCRVPARRAPR